MIVVPTTSGEVRVQPQPQPQPSDAEVDAARAKAAVLTEALPWLARFSGRTVVVKYGGNAMLGDDLRRAFAQDVMFLRYAGVRVVVVHGGGPQVDEHLARLGVRTERVAGLRVTTDEQMDVVRMVLVGRVNRDVVGLLNAHAPLAVGLSGEDGDLLVGTPRTEVVDGREVDLGRTGDVALVRPQVVTALLDAGRVPVVATVARAQDGGVLNINADTAAASLAVALGAEKLVVLTDVAGLYADWPDSTEVVGEIRAEELARLLPTLSAGMVPKMEATLRAVRGGVPRATVLDGRVEHALLLEVFTDSGVGTMVLP